MLTYAVQCTDYPEVLPYAHFASRLSASGALGLRLTSWPIGAADAGPMRDDRRSFSLVSTSRRRRPTDVAASGLIASRTD